MKFPYGICDFKKVVTQGYYYCDRTSVIPLLEDYGDSLLFLRPRRFGKSLLLSMLANYYDVALKDDFEELFGGLEIAKNPTDLRNGYLVLKWDFSHVDPSVSIVDAKKHLYDHVNSSIKDFILHYNRPRCPIFLNDT